MQKRNKTFSGICCGQNADACLMKPLLPFIVISVFSFIIYYLLNISTPAFGDDVIFQFEYQGWYTENITAQRVTGIGQILRGMALYYNDFRGRIIAQGLTQFFGVYGKQYFNILNALAFTSITFLVYLHSNYGKRPKWFLYLAVCVTFWFFTPDMMATTLWMAGSFHECWVIVFTLLFLLPYRAIITNPEAIKKPLATLVLVIPTGFLAGAFNEQTFGLSIGFAVLAMMYVFYFQRKVPVWSIVGLISTILGSMFVLLAPGNTIETLNKYGKTPKELFFDSFPDNVYNAIRMTYNVVGWMIIIIVILAYLLIKDIRASKNKTNKRKKNAGKPEKPLLKRIIESQNGLLVSELLLLCAIASVVITTAMPYIDYRLFFSVFVAFGLVLFSLVAEAAERIANSKSLLKNIFENKYVLIALSLLVCGVVLFDFSKEYAIYHQHFRVYNEVVQSIEDRIAEGEKDIVINTRTQVRARVLPERRLRSFLYFWSITDVDKDPNALNNRWYAYYLGADSIRRED